MNQNQLPTVGILIFDDGEVLDFCGPFEVFSVARPIGEHSDEFKLFIVVAIAEEDKIITWSFRFYRYNICISRSRIC